jgi:hypothetical protein
MVQAQKTQKGLLQETKARQQNSVSRINSTSFYAWEEVTIPFN